VLPFLLCWCSLSVMLCISSCLIIIKVVSNSAEEKEVPMMWLWYHHLIFLLIGSIGSIGSLIFVGAVLASLFFSPSFVECANLLVGAATRSASLDGAQWSTLSSLSDVSTLAQHCLLILLQHTFLIHSLLDL
jgi:hypothetical protein